VDKIKTYQLLTFSIIYVLILSQSFNSISPYFSFSHDLESTAIEFPVNDGESEEEENKKEKEEKIRYSFDEEEHTSSHLSLRAQSIVSCIKNEHLEITTPPPEFF